MSTKVKSDKEDPRHFYMLLRDPQGHPRASLAMTVLIPSKDPLVSIAFSACNPKDCFNKKQAFQRAMGRTKSSSYSIRTNASIILTGFECSLNELAKEWNSSTCYPSSQIRKLAPINEVKFKRTFNSFLDDIKGVRQDSKSVPISDQQVV